MLEENGDLEESLAAFDLFLAAKPESARNLQRRARVKEKLGDLRGALADLEASLKLRPSHQLTLESARRVKAALAKQ